MIQYKIDSFYTNKNVLTITIIEFSLKSYLRIANN